MPVYEYLCEHCGPFTIMRPMAECELAGDCPECAGASPRVIISAPRLSTLSRERRSAAAANERSADAPRTLSEMKAAHRPGCLLHRQNGALDLTSREWCEELPDKTALDDLALMSAGWRKQARPFG